MSLSRNTVAERVDQPSTNLKEQLVGKGKDFIAYSLAVDESTDTSDIAQLSIFVRGVDSSLSITEELLALRPIMAQLQDKICMKSTYLCERLFSLMKLNKTSHRNRLTDQHLHSILRISSAQSLTPNTDELVQKMRRHQVSGSSSDK
uniref:HAT C-terminal dimerisation domain-containing protein n=1 Tax=Nothobranchius furzeri TaxID=105023 RepID=A0A1A8ABQ2_NOTFU